MDGNNYNPLKDKDNDDVRFITDHRPVVLEFQAAYAPGGQEPAYNVTQGPVAYVSARQTPTASESSGWHIGSINADEVWPEYTGLGVTVAVLDGGFQNYNHSDIDDNIDFVNADPNGENYATPDSDNDHGQATIGLVGAEANGDDYVGIAYNADLVPLTWELSNLLGAASFADVMNNSWGYTTPFNTTGVAHAHQGVVNGRGGLGSVILFAAGNYGDIGEDAGVFGLTATPDTITVGAMDTDGTAAFFTNPGASVLITAPGVQLNTLEGDNGTRTDFSGTSGATPIASGVAALILEANPDLGYRDVQQIFALSTQYNDSGGASWQYNGADNWNGGGMHFSHLHGYGLVDARAAVRLAETWDEQNTWSNLDSHTQWETPGSAIPDAGAALTDTMTITSGNALQIETVEVYINIPDHTWVGDLTITLTSPDGTVSTLVDQLYQGGYDEDGLSYEFLTNAHRGESSEGVWTLSVTDNAVNDTGTLSSWSLTFNGQDHSDDDTYFYTDDYSMYASDNSRNELIDTTGIDTLNMAMMTGDITIDLAPGSVNDLAGDNFTIDGGATIENVYTGDGDDDITGNSSDNILFAGRGDNMVNGRGGDDTFHFWDDLSEYTMSMTATGIVTAVWSGMTTIVRNVENFIFDTVSYTYSALEDIVAPLNIDGTANADSLEGNYRDNNINAKSGDDIVNGGDGDDNLSGRAGNDDLYGEEGNDVISGGSGDDNISGGNGDDFLKGNDGNDVIMGGNGEDLIQGLDGDDNIYGGNAADDLRGGGGDDYIEGGGNSDKLIGNQRPDELHGGDGNDDLRGGGGHDTIYGDDGNDVLKGNHGRDTLYGGDGNDSLYGGDVDDYLDGGWLDDDLWGGLGADVFNFGTNSGIDTVHDFNTVTDNDVLQFTDVLGGYNPGGGDVITDWLMIVDSGADSIVSIDRDGTGGAFGMEQVALLEGITGLTDEAALEAGGTIVI